MLSTASGSRATIERHSRRRLPEEWSSGVMGRWVRSTGSDTSSSFSALDETSQPIDVLLAVSRDAPAKLGAQIEDQLRRAIRGGVLRPGMRVPSTRDLARQLGVSRRIAVEAYSQLAAEGYLSL